MNWGWLNSKYHIQMIIVPTENANHFLKTIEPYRLRTYQVTGNGDKVCIWYEVKD